MPRAFELNAIVPSDIITLVEQFRKKTIATQCYLLYRYTIISKYIFSKSQLTQYDPCSSQSQRTILQKCTLLTNILKVQNAQRENNSNCIIKVL